MLIYNRKLVKLHRDRAVSNFHQHDFLLNHTLQDLLERIQDHNKTYSLALDLGCGTGQFSKKLLNNNLVIENLIQADISFKMLQSTFGNRVQLDEELLPFTENIFDLVVSNLNLHWVNDLPGTLSQINRILKPQGIFIGSIIGGKSLIELRKVLIEAEGILNHPVASHISPMIDAADAATLLQRTKFLKPVTDSITLTVSYTNLNHLMSDLQGMAQSNCLGHLPPLSRNTIDLANSIYQEKYSENGKLLATFEIVTFYGTK
jgi:SAM-dependent methyltransferase